MAAAPIEYLSHPLDAHPAKQPFHWRDAIPLLTSVGFHAGLIGVGLLAYQTIVVINAHVDQPTINFNDLPVDRPLAMQGDWSPHSTGPISERPTQNTIDEPADGWAHTRGVSMDDPGSASAEVATVFAPGIRSSIGQVGTGHGDGHGKGEGPGDGSGEGGRLARFGPVNTGTNVFHIGKPVRSIAFVCDRSGSMLSTLPSLKAELTKAVQNLHASQGFSLIFFSDSKPLSLSPGLLPATPKNMRQAETFLSDVTASGTTDPLPALRLAFAQKPEMIFLLTDGDFPDNEAVRHEIQKLNVRSHIQVNTIAFLDDTGVTDSFAAFLKSIANENNGTFRPVKSKDLQ